MLVDQLCQAYHWSYDEVLSRTMPQILLLNHAASVNAERMRLRMESRSTHRTEQNATNPVVWKGKRLSELDSNDLAQYYSDWS